MCNAGASAPNKRLKSITVEYVHSENLQSAHVLSCSPSPLSPLCSYVAMGCIATLGTDPPPRSCVKCLRADAAVRADPGRTPLWSIAREARTMPPLSGELSMRACAARRLAQHAA